MEPIDIVVTFLDDSDPIWQKSFEEYKDKEIKEGTAQVNNKQAFGKDRTRDWDTLRYWFRGVEKNCPWVNKVIIIVQGPSQVPSWLNTDNPKLRVVYHDEYIPKELLPTFNDRPIEMYTCRIEGLANNYIRCNDDCYFLNPIPQDMFFKDGKPVLPDNKRPFKYFTLGTNGRAFWGALNNNMKIEEEYLNGKDYTYGITHLQMPCDKRFELKILEEQNDKILKGLMTSRFRNINHYTIYLFDDLERICENAIIDDNIFKKSLYISLNPNINWNDLRTKQCACINDTDQADKEYEKIKRQLKDFFEIIFPNKSSFEK